MEKQLVIFAAVVFIGVVGCSSQVAKEAPAPNLALTDKSEPEASPTIEAPPDDLLHFRGGMSDGVLSTPEPPPLPSLGLEIPDTINNDLARAADELSRPSLQSSVPMPPLPTAPPLMHPNLQAPLLEAMDAAKMGMVAPGGTAPVVLPRDVLPSLQQ